MNEKEIYEYLLSNINKVYNSFNNTFGLDKKEFKTLVLNLLKSFNYNEMLKEKYYSPEIFYEENLENLKEELDDIELDNETQKKIITKSPIITLYSNDLDDIYYLYKNKKYCGYTVLDDKKYYTYLYNENLTANIVSNNYVIDRMLEYYKVMDNSKDNFDKLESYDKVKNYYYKKKKRKKKNTLFK